MLPIWNNSTMNIGVHLSFWLSIFIFFKYISRSGIFRSYSSSIFSFSSSFYTVSHSTNLQLPPTVYKFLFSTSLSMLVTSYLFDDSHSDRCEVVFQCGFWFAFLWWLIVLNIFSCAHWPSAGLLWKNVYSSLMLII